MKGVRLIWLVALREMRERSRTGAFRASVLIMLVVVVGAIVGPTLLDFGGGTKQVGLVGDTSDGLARAIDDQSAAVGATVQVRRYDSLSVAEDAVRDGDIDLLVVDARTLESRRAPDEQLRAVVTGAIQSVALLNRAEAAGMSADALSALLAPVPVTSVQLGSVEGRSPDDELAAFVMNVLLFMAISTYGSMVLSGVVEEKSSRVVEVLLAHIPARTLLAGKVAGIGLLGLAQFAITALAALVAVTTVDSVDIPAVRPAVLAWVVVWFVLGYALYAVVYGAVGSFASRTEDSSSVAGPVTVVLVAAYFASFATVGRPESMIARILSYFPPTAPLAMPNRIAMGGAEWWEPVLAALLALAAIAGLIEFGGRMYAGAILRTGPLVRLRDVLRRAPR